MTNAPRYVVVSGLPASGKTTLAHALAEGLDLPLLDKDDILEALFDALGAGDLDWRQRLSRASDGVLMRLAMQAQGAVLTSFWRHRDDKGEAGTPSAWLAELPGAVVEVHCRCPVDIALARFRARTRHPGHNDAVRLRGDLSEPFRAYAARGSLGIGRLVTVDTSGNCNAAKVLTDVRRALQTEAHFRQN